MNIEEKAIEVLKHCKDRNFSAFDKIYFDDGTNMCIYQAIETLLTAYEKVKGENVKLRLQDIPLIEGELKAYKDRVNELKQELEKEKEKNKRLEKFIENGEHTWKQKYNETFKYVEDEFVSKDKIKAKIKELEKGNKNTFIRGEKILVLQSLLEKE